MLRVAFNTINQIKPNSTIFCMIVAMDRRNENIVTFIMPNVFPIIIAETQYWYEHYTGMSREIMTLARSRSLWFVDTSIVRSFTILLIRTRAYFVLPNNQAVSLSKLNRKYKKNLAIYTDMFLANCLADYTILCLHWICVLKLDRHSAKTQSGRTNANDMTFLCNG